MNLDDKTKIPLFAALGAAITLFGFSFWLTMVYSVALEAQKINEKQDTKLEMLYEIKADVAVIKQILEHKK